MRRPGDLPVRGGIGVRARRPSLPAVYVPLPIGNGEQRFNALPVVKAGGGLMVADKDFTAQWVQSHVPSLLAEPDRLRELGDKAWEYGIRDAADTILRRVLELA